MNTWMNCGIKVLVTVLFLGAAVVPACAQRGKGIKLVTKVLGKKPPLTGTASVARPPVMPHVPPAVLNTTVERQVTQATTVQAQLPQPKDFLTGPQALQTFRPGWKSELMLSGFTRQQLDLVEHAFKETDQILFETDEAGTWLKPRLAEWDYLARYTQILMGDTWGEMALNDGQIKTLFGKFSRLDDVFTRLNLQAFWLVNKRAPKSSAPGEEGKLARKVKYNLDKRDGSKMTPEVEGYIYGKMHAQLKTPKPNYGPKGRTPNRTPEQVWEEVTQYMRANDGEIPNRTAKNEYARQLRGAWDRIYHTKQTSNDPYVKRLIKLHEETVREKSATKTPQATYNFVTWFMQAHNGKVPSARSQDPVEKSYFWAFVRFHQKYKDLSDIELEALKNEVERDLETLYRVMVQKQADAKTPQEIYDYVTQFMQGHNGELPSRYGQDPVEKSYRLAFTNFHTKYKELSDAELETLEDEEDRNLEKLYRATVQKKAATKTPQAIYDYVTQFMQKHNGKLPSRYGQDPMEKSYRLALENFHQKYKELSNIELETLEDAIERDLENLYRRAVRAYHKKDAEYK